MSTILWSIFVIALIGAGVLFIYKRPRNPADFLTKIYLRIWRNVFIWVSILLLLGSFAIQSPDIPEIYKTWTPIGRTLAAAPDFWMIVGVLLSFLGCYYWAKYKSQSGWHALLGLMSVIGFIGLMGLEDRHIFPEEQRPDITE
jgi:hypothetical protein